ncbi:hypothetical protein EBQ34_01090 [Vandammella animalimorsus]|uniref:Mor transcription activator domain-containing protein n=1 Tax=Vandammella animalimorsus TaxID=2029117 RepID=A0A3M6RUD1_9BURK|nr:Mor transcription activator family protein [Vandammella animalimorsus]RMX18980.1 hypothetical protein EBQ34_01090 [Vandammella animalimorsus]
MPAAAQATSVPVDLLPPLLQDFVSRIGVQPTMALVQRLGGVRIYVPSAERCGEDHPIAQIIGLPNLQALAQEYGGQPHFQLPNAKAALLAVRNAQIVADYQQLSVRQIALKYGLTEGHVGRILSAAGASKAHQDAQQSLL